MSNRSGEGIYNGKSIPGFLILTIRELFSTGLLESKFTV